MDAVHVGKKKLRDSKVMTILSRNGNHKEFRKSRAVRIGDKHHRGKILGDLSLTHEPYNLR